MAYKRTRCYVCREIGASQSHHLIPLEYDGPVDGPQVDLCPRCHLVCHYEANAKYKTGDYLSLEDTFKDEKTFERAAEIVELIVKSRLIFEDKGDPAHAARRRVSFQCTNDELLLLHSLKKQAKFTNLERFLKRIVTEYIVNSSKKR